MVMVMVPWQISIQWSDCEMMNGFVQELFNSCREKLVSVREPSLLYREPCTAIYSFVPCFMLKIKKKLLLIKPLSHVSHLCTSACFFQSF